MHEIAVIKLNTAGQETFRWNGNTLYRDDTSIILEAYFQFKDLEFHGMPLHKGDRFIETYYADRWYNVFEIHAYDNDLLRGWYCNITYPAILTDDRVSFIDLALDLLIFPDGRQIVLDEEEFSQLVLPPEDIVQARKALQSLQNDFISKFRGK